MEKRWHRFVSAPLTGTPGDSGLTGHEIAHELLNLVGNEFSFEPAQILHSIEPLKTVSSLGAVLLHMSIFTNKETARRVTEFINSNS